MDVSLVSIDSARFSAFVTYEQPPFEKLQRQFSDLQPDFKYRQLKPIRYCRDVSTRNREIICAYFRMGREALLKDVLAAMNCYRLRPALYEELLAFAEKYPDEQQKHPIAALGSAVCITRRDHYAELTGLDGRQSLRLSTQDRLVLNSKTGAVDSLISHNETRLLAVHW